MVREDLSVHIQSQHARLVPMIRPPQSPSVSENPTWRPDHAETGLTGHGSMVNRATLSQTWRNTGFSVVNVYAVFVIVMQSTNTRSLRRLPCCFRLHDCSEINVYPFT